MPIPMKNDDGRKAGLRALHATAREIGLDEETRRDVMEKVTGRRSAAELSAHELRRCVAEMKRSAPPDSRRAVVAKLRALWISGYWLGAVRNREDSALTSFVKRQVGVDRLQWLNPSEADRAIEAIKSMMAREGVNWGRPSVVCWDSKDPNWERKRVIVAQINKLIRMGQIPRGGAARVKAEAEFYRSLPGEPSTIKALDAAQCDEAIRRLGERIRSLVEAE